MTTHQPQARALLANGYLIIPIYPRAKRPALAEWQHARLGALDVPRLWANGAGVGVLCGVGSWPVVGVDIDVHDERLAALVERWCEVHLGATCVRVGKAPKRLLAYRAEEAGWPKISSQPFATGEVVSRLEVLGAGQQFVAHGIHPDTGRAYDWLDVDGGLEGLEASALPVVTRGQLIDLVGWFNRAARDAGLVENAPTGRDRNEGGTSRPVGEGGRSKNLGAGAPSTGIGVPSAATGPQGVATYTRGQSGKADDARQEVDPLLEVHAPPMGLPLADAERVLTGIDATDYDAWLRVGMGLHHEYEGRGADVGEAAFEVWRAWSEREGGAKYAGEEDCRRRWESFGHSVGPGLDRAPVTLRGVLGMAGVPVRLRTDGSYAVGKGADKVRRARTEMGNAERMLDAYGAGLMYVPELKRWFKWTGVHWARALDAEIQHLAKSTVLALRDEVELWPEGDEREGFYKFCASSQKAAMVANMITLASSDPRVVVPASELDREWWALGVRNGVVDLRSGVLLPPDRERRVTLVCGCEYEVGASSGLWEATIGDVFFDDAEMVAFFQRLVGYSLCGRPEEDVLVIPFGSGCNGKSTLMSVLKAAFGDYHHAAAAESFVGRGAGGGGASQVGPRPDLLAMRGARLVWVGEPDQGAELREGFVKSVSGGDPIPCRANHSNEIVQMQPSWVTWMPTNHRPIVRGDDWAIWRRLMLLPFQRDFDNDPVIVKDASREKQLVNGELPGVLAWMIRGARDYLHGGLRPPSKVAAARAQYREDMDLLAEWLQECCDLAPDARESMAALWSSWEFFARSRGELGFVASAKALSRRLESRGFKRLSNATGHNVRGFLGLNVQKNTGL